MRDRAPRVITGFRVMAGQHEVFGLVAPVPTRRPGAERDLPARHAWKTSHGPYGKQTRGETAGATGAAHSTLSSEAAATQAGRSIALG